MKADKAVVVNRVGQLIIVVAGFIATGLILIAQAIHGRASVGRFAVMLIIALGLAVRYWWVILLLAWPFRITRTALLLMVWLAMPLTAAVLQADQAWVFMLAVLCSLGAATEYYNFATKQWRAESQKLTRVLRQDHIVGAITALAAAAALAGLGVWQPKPLTGWVAVLALADWVRLISMVVSHRRLLNGS